MMIPIDFEVSLSMIAIVTFNNVVVRVHCCWQKRHFFTCWTLQHSGAFRCTTQAILYYLWNDKLLDCLSVHSFKWICFFLDQMLLNFTHVFIMKICRYTFFFYDWMHCHGKRGFHVNFPFLQKSIPLICCREGLHVGQLIWLNNMVPSHEPCTFYKVMPVCRRSV